MKITKYILLFTLFCFNLYGGSEKLVQKMHYETSYEQTLEKAQKLNKPIMMVIAQEGCPWCNKFEIKTLTKKNIDTIVQKNFIPLTIIREKNNYPEKFRPKGVPTVLFIDPKKEETFYKSFGYKSKREYTIELEKAIDLFKEI
jgi:thioredoxin-related protein